MELRRALNIVLLGTLLLFVASCGSVHVDHATRTANEKNPARPAIVQFPPSDAKAEWFDHSSTIAPQQFVTFAQCQFDIPCITDPATSLPVAAAPENTLAYLRRCVEIAETEHVDVLVFPELTLALPAALRSVAMKELSRAADRNRMIIIGGSFYDANRYARVPVFGPGWTDLGYKFRPSRAEVSPVAGKGMRNGPAVPVVKTDKGTFLILTCVDMLSDDVQYLTRKLATSQQIHVVINNSYNPAGLEFLVEANSLARRHPVFVLVTNVMKTDVEKDGPYSFGHTALLANLRTNGNTPDSYGHITEYLPDSLLLRDERDASRGPHVAFDTVVADLGVKQRAMLIYDLNLRLTRVPQTTNAPDQGYPPVRNLRVVSLESHKKDHQKESEGD